MDLTGKTVVVTGANGNLGLALSNSARSRGAEVVMLDIVFSGPALQADARRYQVDLLDSAATAACIQGLGDIDALCNIAGGFAMGTAVHEASDEEWDSMFALNVRTLLNSVRATVPIMQARRAGCIVNVGAAAAIRGEALMGPYLVAKSAVIRITEAMAEELKADGINVNCVLPAVFDTPQNREAMPDADFTAWVTAQQLADTVCFLISDAASGLVGASVAVRNQS
ncbi:MAG: SDR family NAD(P)-dependent oxidoreductase [Halieaceae bacterium]|nr:SDR family NAD(P)-dependent oxidoreductase [Halieaceae bacterium]